MGYVRTALAVSLTALLALGSSEAFAADWKLVEVAGVVRIASPGKAPISANANQVLPVGSIVTTAAGGRAALFNGAQRITLGPNSRMTVAPESNAGMTRILQDLGSILFQIDKKPSQHFSVETPLLAAIVKGTTFTVNVEMSADSVHVAEGLVEVRANEGGAMRDVGAGATGVIARSAPEQLSVETPRASTDAPLPQQTAAIDYNVVSGGLVEGPAAAGAAAPSGPMRSTAETSSPVQAAGPVASPLAQASTMAFGGTNLATSGDTAVASLDVGPGPGIPEAPASGGNENPGGASTGGSSNGAGGGNSSAGGGNDNAGGGNAGGNGNSSGGGNSNAGGGGNDNAGGNGNGSGGGNAGGNSNSSGGGNSNAGSGGNDSSGGVNAGGSGNSSGGGNSNAGGGGNSSGNGNSSAGGGSNTGGGNSNAGSGGNDSSGGGNAGGSGNSSGGGNSNAGSGGNDNAGGNGNSSGGGNSSAGGGSNAGGGNGNISGGGSNGASGGNSNAGGGNNGGNSSGGGNAGGTPKE